jgi:hypothetical protein
MEVHGVQEKLGNVKRRKLFVGGIKILKADV